MLGSLTRVLLADDSPEFLKAATSFIEVRPDLRVIGTAASGVEAVKAVEVLAPDIVFLDYQMPGMTGLEAARVIKTSHPTLPIVIVSLDNEVRHRLVGHESDVDGFIAKASFVEMCPVVIATLLANAGHKDSALTVPAK